MGYEIEFTVILFVYTNGCLYIWVGLSDNDVPMNIFGTMLFISSFIEYFYLFKQSILSPG